MEVQTTEGIIYYNVASLFVNGICYDASLLFKKIAYSVVKDLTDLLLHMHIQVRESNVSILLHNASNFFQHISILLRNARDMPGICISLMLCCS